jgi:hypothetical protein
MRGFLVKCLKMDNTNTVAKALKNQKCPFTDLQIHNLEPLPGWHLRYTIYLGKSNCIMILSQGDFDKIEEFLKTKKWIIKGLLLNGIWHKETYTTPDVLNRLVDSGQSIVPFTPKEKKDKILSDFYKKQEYDGQPINIPNHIAKDDSFWARLFMKNRREFLFYLDLLQKEKLLAYFTGGPAGEDIVLSSYTILSKGIEYVLSLQEGDYSSSCFVAMSFTDEMFKVFDEAIQPAIEVTGFKPLLISKEHLSSDTTINDGIIASIKKSRFTIADFTDNRNGVYFEAGFALGRGQKVIYTCKESDLKNLHFDIRAYQQIVWKDAADFKQKLIDKIEAFIK